MGRAATGAHSSDGWDLQLPLLRDAAYRHVRCRELHRRRLSALSRAYPRGADGVRGGGRRPSGARRARRSHPRGASLVRRSAGETPRRYPCVARAAGRRGRQDSRPGHSGLADWRRHGAAQPALHTAGIAGGMAAGRPRPGCSLRALRKCRAFRTDYGNAIPARAAACVEQRRLCRRLRRGEGDRFRHERRAHRRADYACSRVCRDRVLARAIRALEPGRPRGGPKPRLVAVEVRASVRSDERGDARWPANLAYEQIRIQLVAADHCDPTCRRGSQ